MNNLINEYLNKIDNDIDYFKRVIKILKKINDELKEESKG